MKRFVAIVIVFLLIPLLGAIPVNASIAQRAVFGVSAFGNCLVDLEKASPYPEREYVEIATGSFNFYGEGTIEGLVDFKGIDVYELDSASQKALGFVRAVWKHNGARYEFRAVIYITESTRIFVEPVFNRIITGNYPGEPYTLRYFGSFKVDSISTPVSGDCCFGVGPYNGNSAITFRFTISGYPQFGLTWAKEADIVDLWGPYYYYAPAAVFLGHDVKVTD